MSMQQVAKQIHIALHETFSFDTWAKLLDHVNFCIKTTAASKYLHISYLLSVLGWRLTALNAHAQAEAAHRRALCIATKVLGPDHPELACSMDWLSFSLLVQGNFKEAVLLCYSSMVIVCRTVGPTHPSIASCYFNLVTILEVMGLFDYVELLRYKAYLFIQNAPLYFQHCLGPEIIRYDPAYDRSASPSTIQQYLRSE